MGDAAYVSRVSRNKGVLMISASRPRTRRSVLATIALSAAVLLAGPAAAASASTVSAAHSGSAHAAAAATVTVPNVVGKTAYSAKRKLSKIGLGHTYLGGFVVLSKKWVVTAQLPAAKATVPKGTKIVLTVAKKAAAKAQPSAPSGPVLTPSQTQALLAAKGYLASGMGFSYQGLIDQLSSAYGNGFPVADATTAVDSLGVDWNAQAVIAAKGYLASGMGFSHASLVQQLSSAYGNKFTADQAEYAATQVGL
jgi:hypothetical protein